MCAQSIQDRRKREIRYSRSIVIDRRRTAKVQWKEVRAVIDERSISVENSPATLLRWPIRIKRQKWYKMQNTFDDRIITDSIWPSRVDDWLIVANGYWTAIEDSMTDRPVNGTTCTTGCRQRRGCGPIVSLVSHRHHPIFYSNIIVLIDPIPFVDLCYREGMMRKVIPFLMFTFLVGSVILFAHTHTHMNADRIVYVRIIFGHHRRHLSSLRSLLPRFANLLSLPSSAYHLRITGPIDRCGPIFVFSSALITYRLISSNNYRLIVSLKQSTKIRWQHSIQRNSFQFTKKPILTFICSRYLARSFNVESQHDEK